MKLIETTDLWLEQNDNMQDCFDGAFTDGFSNGIPFDSFKIVKNCNCSILTWPRNIKVMNKHHAIVYYKDGEVVRLMLINKNTNVDECISKALNQIINNRLLVDIFIENSITSRTVDMKEKPIENEYTDEIALEPADRPKLLKNMLNGSFTEDDTDLGAGKELLEFKNRMVRFFLATDEEVFRIMCKSAFVNKDSSRMIVIQTDGFNKKLKH